MQSSNCISGYIAKGDENRILKGYLLQYSWLFTIAKMGRQPKSLSMDESVKKKKTWCAYI